MLVAVGRITRNAPLVPKKVQADVISPPSQLGFASVADRWACRCERESRWFMLGLLRSIATGFPASSCLPDVRSLGDRHQLVPLTP
jgi:hypothetical protein